MIQKISGTVIHGNALGRTIGFRTANIKLQNSDISDSVFVLSIIIKNNIYSGIGTYQIQKGVFEAHIFDFSEDIYGENVEIVLLEKIRDNQKFENFEAVKNQIQQDKVYAQNLELIVLTFGSFDVLHPGHKYYLSEAKKYGTKLITIIATDNNIKKIKRKSPHNNQETRQKEIEELHISDEVYIGSEGDPLSWVERFRPHTICLGYDQRGTFVDSLSQEIQKLGINTKIIRIPAYHPEKYKSSILKRKSHNRSHCSLSPFVKERI